MHLVLSHPATDTLLSAHPGDALFDAVTHRLQHLADTHGLRLRVAEGAWAPTADGTLRPMPREGEPTESALVPHHPSGGTETPGPTWREFTPGTRTLEPTRDITETEEITNARFDAPRHTGAADVSTPAAATALPDGDLPSPPPDAVRGRSTSPADHDGVSDAGSHLRTTIDRHSLSDDVSVPLVRALPSSLARGQRLGPAGRIVNLGEVHTRVVEILRAVVRSDSHPPDLAGLIQDRLDTSRRELGDQEWADWLLHGGDTVQVTLPAEGKAPQRVYRATVELVLPDRGVREISAAAAGDRGEKTGVPWDPEADIRGGHSSKKTVTWDASVTAQKAFPGVSVGLTTGGSGGRSLGHSQLTVAQHRRTAPTGDAVYFRYPYAQVKVTIHQEGDAVSEPVHSHLTRGVVIAVPESRVPRAPAAVDGLAPRSRPGTELIRPAPGRGHSPRIQGLLDDALWEHATTPEMVDGLEALHGKILDRLPAGAIEPGSRPWRQLQQFLAERTQQHHFSHLAGMGHASETIQVGKHTLGVVLRSHLHAARRLEGPALDSDTWEQYRNYHWDGPTRSVPGDWNIALAVKVGPIFTFGSGAAYGLGLNPHVGFGTPLSRDMNTSQSGTRWQKLTSHGPSTDYEVDLRLTVPLRSDLPGVADEVHHDVRVHLRVPLEQSAAFESALAAAQEPARPPAKPPVADHEAALLPPAIREGRGTGPAFIVFHGAARDIGPTVLDLIAAARAARSLAPFSPLDEHQLHRQVAADFSLDGLNAQSYRLATADRPLLRRIALPDGSAADVAVTARRVGDLLSTSTSTRSVNLVRAALHQTNHADTMSLSVKVGIDVAFNVGLSTLTRGRLGTFGITGGYSFGRTSDQTVGTGDLVSVNSGSPLLNGPSRHFDYTTDFEISVTLHDPSGLAAARGNADAGPLPLVRDALPWALRNTPTPNTRTAVVRGARMSYWVPQALLFTPPDPAHTSHSPNPDTRPEQTREHLESEDMLLDLITPPELAKALASMLEDAEAVPPADIALLADRLTDTTRLITLFQHGDRAGGTQIEIRHTDGRLHDKIAVVRITASLARSQPVSKPVSSGRLEFAETTPAVSDGHNTARTHSGSADLSLGIPISAASPGSPHGSTTPDGGSGYSRGPAAETDRLHKVTTGTMQIDGPADYEHRLADIVYTVEVEHWRENTFGRSRTESAHTQILVPQGLEFLRRISSQASPPPPGVPYSIDPAAMPLSAAPRRITFIPTHLAHDPGHNPLVDIVLDLLHRKVPALQHTSAAELRSGLKLITASRIALPLHQLLSPESLRAFMPQLRSTGLRLTPQGPDAPWYVLIHAREPGKGRHEEFRPAMSTSGYHDIHDWEIATRTDSATGNVSLGPGGEMDPVHGPLSEQGQSMAASTSRTRTTSAARTEIASNLDLVMFQPGAHLYGQDLTLTVAVKRVVQPSPVAVNRLLGGLPDRIRAALHRADDPTPDDTRELVVHQQVAVPHTLIGPSAAGRNIPRNPRITYLNDPGYQMPGLFPVQGHPEPQAWVEPFPLDPRALGARDAVLTAIDPDALGEMHRQLLRLLARPAGQTLPRYSGPGLLAEWGTGSEEALRDLLSEPLARGFLARALTSEGYLSPELARPGGPLTDTRGRIRIRARLFNPRSLDWVELSHSWEEHGRTRQTGAVSVAKSVRVGLQVGTTAQAAALAPASISLSAGRTSAKNLSGTATTHTLRPGGTYVDRPDQRYLQVRAGVVYTLTLESENRRGRIGYGADARTFRFRLDDAVELLLHPDHVDTLAAQGLPLARRLTLPKPLEQIEADALGRTREEYRQLTTEAAAIADSQDLPVDTDRWKDHLASMVRALEEGGPAAPRLRADAADLLHAASGTPSPHAERSPQALAHLADRERLAHLAHSLANATPAPRRLLAEALDITATLGPDNTAVPEHEPLTRIDHQLHQGGRDAARALAERYAAPGVARAPQPPHETEPPTMADRSDRPMPPEPASARPLTPAEQYGAALDPTGASRLRPVADIPPEPAVPAATSGAQQSPATRNPDPEDAERLGPRLPDPTPSPEPLLPLTPPTLEAPLVPALPASGAGGPVELRAAEPGPAHTSQTPENIAHGNRETPDRTHVQTGHDARSLVAPEHPEREVASPLEALTRQTVGQTPRNVQIGRVFNSLLPDPRTADLATTPSPGTDSTDLARHDRPPGTASLGPDLVPITETPLDAVPGPSAQDLTEGALQPKLADTRDTHLSLAPHVSAEQTSAGPDGAPKPAGPHTATEPVPSPPHDHAPTAAEIPVERSKHTPRAESATTVPAVAADISAGRTREDRATAISSDTHDLGHGPGEEASAVPATDLPPDDVLPADETSIAGIGAMIGPLHATVDVIVPADRLEARTHLHETITGLTAELAKAATQAELDSISSRLGRVYIAVEAWRSAQLPRTAALPAARPDQQGRLLERPEWYEALLPQVNRVLSRLTVLPTRQHGQLSGEDGRRWTRVEARAELEQAVVRLASAYAGAAGQLAVTAGTGHITSADPLLAEAPQSLPDHEQHMFAWSTNRLRDARQHIEELLTELDRQTSGTDLRPYDLPSVSKDWQPKLKYLPPEHLTGENPTLGHDVPISISPQTVLAIQEEVFSTLPEHLRTDASRRTISDQTTPELLLRHAPQLVGDHYLVQVADHAVRVRVKPGGWRQMSDALEIRNASRDIKSDFRSRTRGHGYFADVNLNVGYGLQAEAGSDPFQLNAVEAFKGFFTMVTGEHSETHNIKVQTSQGKTVKNSSYQSLLFAYDVTVHVEVEGPPKVSLLRSLGGGRTQSPVRHNTPPTVENAVSILSSREALRPADTDAAAAQGARHLSDQVETIPAAARFANPDPATGRHVAVPTPANSVVEAFAGSVHLRRAIERVAGDLAPVGSAARRRLDTSTGVTALKNIVASASRGHGHDIVFGDHAGRTPAAVSVTVRLTRPQVVIERDDATWMDIDDRATRVAEWALAHEDSIDIPPGLMLFALNFGVRSKDTLTPWLWFWPTLDAELAHTGVSTATTDFGGIRYFGEPTTVTRFAVEAELSRSDRPQDPPVVVQIDGPLWLRTLHKDAAQWAELPQISTSDTGQVPELRLTGAIGLDFGRLHRLTELDGADALLDRVEEHLHERFPGLLPTPGTGTERWNDSLTGHVLANKFAGTNLRQLRQALHPDTLRAKGEQLISKHGYTVPLSKAHAFGLGHEEIVVRIRAQLAETQSDGSLVDSRPEMSAWLPRSEMDISRTEEQDSVLAAVTILGGWLGPQATYSISEVSQGPLEALEFRPMLHGRMVNTKGIAAGKATWALQGAALDGLVEFSGKMVLTATIESSSVSSVPEPSLGLSGAGSSEVSAVADRAGHPGHTVIDMPEDPVGVVVMTDEAEIDLGVGRPRGDDGPSQGLSHAGSSEASAAADGAGHPGHTVIEMPEDPAGVVVMTDEAEIDLGVGRPRGDDTTLPASGTGTGATPERQELSEPMPSGIHETVPVQAEYKLIVPANITSKKVLDPMTGEEIWVPYDVAELGTETLEWRRAENTQLPPEIWVEAGVGNLLDDIMARFHDLGFTRLSPHTRSVIETHLTVAIQAMPSLRQRPMTVWKGELKHQSALDSVTGHKAMGSVELHAVVDQIRTVAVPEGLGMYNDVGAVTLNEVGKETTRGFYAGLRTRLPLAFGSAHKAGAGEGGSEFNPWGLMLQPQTFYRRENTTGEFRSEGGSLGRSTLEMSAMAIGTARVRYVFKVRTWHETRLSHGHDHQERTGEALVSGRAVMTALQATDLGLMPAQSQVRRDFSEVYELPEDQIGSLQGESIKQAPDSGILVDAVEAHVGERYGQAAAHAVTEKVSSVLGQWNTAAAMDLMLHGHEITVPVAGRVHLVLSRLGLDVPTFVPVNRTFTVRLKAELSDPVYQGRVPWTRIGKRYGAEESIGEYSRRAARHGVDPVRLWYNHNQFGKTVNSWYQNANLTLYGQTTRKAALTSGHERSLGTTLDLRGLTAAEFSRTVTWSATVTVETAPPAMADAATLGALQLHDSFDLRPARTSVLVTRHDTHMLHRKGDPSAIVEPPPAPPSPSGEPPDGAPTSRPERDTTQPQQPSEPPVVPTTRQPGWDPALPGIERRPLEPHAAFSLVRNGLRLDHLDAEAGGLLDLVQPLRFVGLDDLEQRVYRLLLPQAAPYPATLGTLTDAAAYGAAVWRNFISDPPPGAGWFNPRLNLRRQAGAVMNDQFLGGRFRQLTTSGVTVPIQLPGRFSTLTADLEILMDITRVQDGGYTVHETMAAAFSSTTQKATADTEALGGWYLGNWQMLGLQLPGHPYATDDNAGPMVGADYLQWNTGSAATGSEHKHSGGVKTTGRDMSLLHFDVVWKVALTPQNPDLWWNPTAWLNPYAYNPKAREYFEDVHRRVSVWVPAEHKQLFLDLRDAVPAPDPAAPGTHANAEHQPPTPPPMEAEAGGKPADDGPTPVPPQPMAPEPVPSTSGVSDTQHDRTPADVVADHGSAAPAARAPEEGGSAELRPLPAQGPDITATLGPDDTAVPEHEPLTRIDHPLHQGGRDAARALAEGYAAPGVARAPQPPHETEPSTMADRSDRPMPPEPAPARPLTPAEQYGAALDPTGASRLRPVADMPPEPAAASGAGSAGETIDIVPGQAVAVLSGLPEETRAALRADVRKILAAHDPAASVGPDDHRFHEIAHLLHTDRPGPAADLASHYFGAQRSPATRNPDPVGAVAAEPLSPSASGLTHIAAALVPPAPDSTIATPAGARPEADQAPPPAGPASAASADGLRPEPVPDETIPPRALEVPPAVTTGGAVLFLPEDDPMVTHVRNTDPEPGALTVAFHVTDDGRPLIPFDEGRQATVDAAALVGGIRRARPDDLPENLLVDPLGSPSADHAAVRALLQEIADRTSRRVRLPEDHPLGSPREILPADGIRTGAPTDRNVPLTSFHPAEGPAVRFDDPLPPETAPDWDRRRLDRLTETIRVQESRTSTRLPRPTLPLAVRGAAEPGVPFQRPRGPLGRIRPRRYPVVLSGAVEIRTPDGHTLPLLPRQDRVTVAVGVTPDGQFTRPTPQGTRVTLHTSHLALEIIAALTGATGPRPRAVQLVPTHPVAAEHHPAFITAARRLAAVVNRPILVPAKGDTAVVHPRYRDYTLTGPGRPRWEEALAPGMVSSRFLTGIDGRLHQPGFVVVGPDGERMYPRADFEPLPAIATGPTGHSTLPLDLDADGRPIALTLWGDGFTFPAQTFHDVAPMLTDGDVSRAYLAVDARTPAREAGFRAWARELAVLRGQRVPFTLSDSQVLEWVDPLPEGFRTAGGGPDAPHALEFPSGAIVLGDGDHTGLTRMIDRWRTRLADRPHELFLARLLHAGPGDVRLSADQQHPATAHEIADWIRAHGHKPGKAVQLLWKNVGENAGDGHDSQAEERLRQEIAADLHAMLYTPGAGARGQLPRGAVRDVTARDVTSGEAGTWHRTDPPGEPPHAPSYITDIYGRLVRPDSRPSYALADSGLALAPATPGRSVRPHPDFFDVTLHLGPDGVPQARLNDGTLRAAEPAEVVGLMQNAALPAEDAGAGDAIWRRQLWDGRPVRLLVDTPEHGPAHEQLTAWTARLSTALEEARPEPVYLYPDGYQVTLDPSPSRPVGIYAPAPGARPAHTGGEDPGSGLDWQDPVHPAHSGREPLWESIAPSPDAPPPLYDGRLTYDQHPDAADDLVLFPGDGILVSAATATDRSALTDLDVIRRHGLDAGHTLDVSPFVLAPPGPDLLRLDVMITPDGSMALLRRDGTPQPVDAATLARILRGPARPADGTRGGLPLWNGHDDLQILGRHQVTTEGTVTYEADPLTHGAAARYHTEIDELAHLLKADVYAAGGTATSRLLAQLHQVASVAPDGSAAGWYRGVGRPGEPARFTTDAHGVLVAAAALPVDDLEQAGIWPGEVHVQRFRGGVSLVPHPPKADNGAFRTDTGQLDDFAADGEFLVVARGGRDQVELAVPARGLSLHVGPNALLRVLRWAGWNGEPIRLAVDGLAFLETRHDDEYGEQIPGTRFGGGLASAARVAVSAPTGSVDWAAARQHARQQHPDTDENSRHRPLPLHGPARRNRWVDYPEPVHGADTHTTLAALDAEQISTTLDELTPDRLDEISRQARQIIEDRVHAPLGRHHGPQPFTVQDIVGRVAHALHHADAHTADQLARHLLAVHAADLATPYTAVDAPEGTAPATAVSQWLAGGGPVTATATPHTEHGQVLVRFPAGLSADIPARERFAILTVDAPPGGPWTVQLVETDRLTPPYEESDWEMATLPLATLYPTLLDEAAAARPEQPYGSERLRAYAADILQRPTSPSALPDLLEARDLFRTLHGDAWPTPPDRPGRAWQLPPLLQQELRDLADLTRLARAHNTHNTHNTWHRETTTVTSEALARLADDLTGSPNIPPLAELYRRARDLTPHGETTIADLRSAAAQPPAATGPRTPQHDLSYIESRIGKLPAEAAEKLLEQARPIIENHLPAPLQPGPVTNGTVLRVAHTLHRAGPAAADRLAGDLATEHEAALTTPRPRPDTSIEEDIPVPLPERADYILASGIIRLYGTLPMPGAEGFTDHTGHVERLVLEAVTHTLLTRGKDQAHRLARSLTREHHYGPPRGGGGGARPPAQTDHPRPATHWAIRSDKRHALRPGTLSAHARQLLRQTIRDIRASGEHRPNTVARLAAKRLIDSGHIPAPGGPPFVHGDLVESALGQSLALAQLRGKGQAGEDLRQRYLRLRRQGVPDARIRAVAEARAAGVIPPSVPGDVIAASTARTWAAADTSQAPAHEGPEPVAGPASRPPAAHRDTVQAAADPSPASPATAGRTFQEPVPTDNQPLLQEFLAWIDSTAPALPSHPAPADQAPSSPPGGGQQEPPAPQPRQGDSQRPAPRTVARIDTAAARNAIDQTIDMRALGESAVEDLRHRYLRLRQADVPDARIRAVAEARAVGVPLPPGDHIDARTARQWATEAADTAGHTTVSTWLLTPEHHTALKEQARHIAVTGQAFNYRDIGALALRSLHGQGRIPAEVTGDTLPPGVVKRWLRGANVQAAALTVEERQRLAQWVIDAAAHRGTNDLPALGWLAVHSARTHSDIPPAIPGWTINPGTVHTWLTERRLNVDRLPDDERTALIQAVKQFAARHPQAHPLDALRSALRELRSDGALTSQPTGDLVETDLILQWMHAGHSRTARTTEPDLPTPVVSPQTAPPHTDQTIPTPQQRRWQEINAAISAGLLTSVQVSHARVPHPVYAVLSQLPDMDTTQTVEEWLRVAGPTFGLATPPDQAMFAHSIVLAFPDGAGYDLGLLGGTHEADGELVVPLSDAYTVDTVLPDYPDPGTHWAFLRPAEPGQP
ncbi:hypothetical protein [Kitasatospora sp. NPDC059571]|uniref:hypothetical protein n=1 Tax=Kitasatospora sp. NPDC059571 TaxID=3346871 RepID=UPI00368DA6AA